MEGGSGGGLQPLLLIVLKTDLSQASLYRYLGAKGSSAGGQESSEWHNKGGMGQWLLNTSLFWSHGSRQLRLQPVTHNMDQFFCSQVPPAISDRGGDGGLTERAP